MRNFNSFCALFQADAEISVSGDDEDDDEDEEDEVVDNDYYTDMSDDEDEDDGFKSPYQERFYEGDTPRPSPPSSLKEKGYLY